MKKYTIQSLSLLLISLLSTTHLQSMEMEDEPKSSERVSQLSITDVLSKNYKPESHICMLVVKALPPTYIEAVYEDIRQYHEDQPDFMSKAVRPPFNKEIVIDSALSKLLLSETTKKTVLFGVIECLNKAEFPVTFKTDIRRLSAETPHDYSVSKDDFVRAIESRVIHNDESKIQCKIRDELKMFKAGLEIFEEGRRQQMCAQKQEPRAGLDGELEIGRETENMLQTFKVGLGIFEEKCRQRVHAQNKRLRLATRIAIHKQIAPSLDSLRETE